jgi:hypothetical protein
VALECTYGDAAQTWLDLNIPLYHDLSVDRNVYLFQAQKCLEHIPHYHYKRVRITEHIDLFHSNSQESKIIVLLVVEKVTLYSDVTPQVDINLQKQL